MTRAGFPKPFHFGDRPLDGGRHQPDDGRLEVDQNRNGAARRVAVGRDGETCRASLRT